MIRARILPTVAHRLAILVYVAFALWLYRTSTDRPGDTIVSRALDRVRRAAADLTRRAGARLQTAKS